MFLSSVQESPIILVENKEIFQKRIYLDYSLYVYMPCSEQVKYSKSMKNCMIFKEK